MRDTAGYDLHYADIDGKVRKVGHVRRRWTAKVLCRVMSWAQDDEWYGQFMYRRAFDVNDWIGRNVAGRPLPAWQQRILHRQQARARRS